jgi:metallo-beta-lactamase family protein
LTVTLHFHGAAGTVTGSCYRIVHPGGQFLVDCGLFQGNKTVRDLNYKPFPFDPRQHRLCSSHARSYRSRRSAAAIWQRQGFRKPIWATAPTSGLLEYLLPDAAGIQESEAERETRKRSRRDEPAFEPLYTLEDAAEVLKLRREVAYESWIEPGPGRARPLLECRPHPRLRLHRGRGR